MTYRKITFARVIIPFYYWIAPTNDAPIKEARKVKSLQDIIKEAEKINQQKSKK